MWPRLAEDGRIADGDRRSLPVAMDGGANAATGGGTGFAIVDSDGLAVACGLTMNALFGAGRTAADTGIAIAAPRPEGAVDPALSPFLVTRESGSDIRFAGAASGTGAESVGPVVALRTLMEADTLESAVALPRTARGPGRRAVVEAAVPEAARAGLREDGFTVVEAGKIGFVAAVQCKERARGDKGGICRAHADLRGAGLAVQVYGE